MKKIITLYQRNYDGDQLVRDEVTPGAEWVLAGEGMPTRKYDGTCCMIRDGRLFKRYDAKGGKVPPAGWEAAEPAPDPKSGHWPGWLPVGDGPEDAAHREAFDRWQLAIALGGAVPDGTYELIGPKIQGNPENAPAHYLVAHSVKSTRIYGEVPRTFDGIRDYLASHDIEGIVWHHPDGRMVKIKGKDLGVRRPSARR